MANAQIGNVYGFAGVTTSTNPQEVNLNGSLMAAGSKINAGMNNSNLNSLAGVRARLKLISAGFYTEDRLDAMTFNDMQYAMRLADHPTTIK